MCTLPPQYVSLPQPAGSVACSCGGRSADGACGCTGGACGCASGACSCGGTPCNSEVAPKLQYPPRANRRVPSLAAAASLAAQAAAAGTVASPPRPSCCAHAARDVGEAPGPSRRPQTAADESFEPSPASTMSAAIPDVSALSVRDSKRGKTQPSSPRRHRSRRPVRVPGNIGGACTACGVECACVVCTCLCDGHPGAEHDTDAAGILL